MFTSESKSSKRLLARFHPCIKRLSPLLLFISAAMLLQLTSFRLLYLILRISSSVWDCAYLRLSVFSILVTNCIV